MTLPHSYIDIPELPVTWTIVSSTRGGALHQVVQNTARLLDLSRTLHTPEPSVGDLHY